MTNIHPCEVAGYRLGLRVRFVGWGLLLQVTGVGLQSQVQVVGYGRRLQLWLQLPVRDI